MENKLREIEVGEIKIKKKRIFGICGLYVLSTKKQRISMMEIMKVMKRYLKNRELDLSSEK